MTNYYKKVICLGEKDQGAPIGRNTLHCRRHKRKEFDVRFLKGIMLSMIYLYSGVFLKVYIHTFLENMGLLEGSYFDRVEIKWVYMSVVSYFPIFCMYSFEILKEAQKGSKNLDEKKRDLLKVFGKVGETK